MASPQVESDYPYNHGRKVARSYLQKIEDAVGNIAQAIEPVWHYTPKLDKQVKTVRQGVDGTSMLFCQEGYRQAMVGTQRSDDKEGERLLTHYQGATPSSRKATFWQRMTQEIAHVKSVYPQANYVGVASVSKDNWSFLEQPTSQQTLDFYHTTGYLKAIAKVAYPHSKASLLKMVRRTVPSIKT